MSIKIPKLINDRELLRELHDIMNLFRTIFAEDKLLCKNIDENYEMILISDIKLVPSQYDREILHYIKVIKLIVTNINFVNLREGMKQLDPDYRTVGIEVDTYKFAEDFLAKLDIPRIDKLQITNVMVKLRPIFACINKLFLSPFAVLSNITKLSNMQYSDLLD